MDMIIKPAPAPDELKDVITISYKDKCQNETFFIPNGFEENNESVGIKVNSNPVSPNILDSSAEGKTVNLNAKSSQKSSADKAQKFGKASKKSQKSNLTITNKTSVKSSISGVPGSSQEPAVVNNKLESKKYSKNGLKKQLQGAGVPKRDYFKFPMNRSRWCDGKGEKPFKCNICEKLYKYMFSLKRHYLRIHINAEYISEADLANCKINVNGDRREKRKDVAAPPNRKRLKTSGSSFESNDGKPGLYKCSFHKVKYDLETELKNHYATVFHPKKEEFICKICKEIFETKAKLCDHVKVCSHINEDVANHCKKCKVTFQSSADYEYHLSIHGNGKFCKYCNKEFSNIANRKRHENLHDGSQSFKCKHCEFSSQAKKDLNIHIRKLHMDLYYRCDKCPKYGIAKIYATKSLLQAHMVERHGEKKELVSKTASPVKLSPKAKSLQNHLKESQVNVVVPKSSILEIKNVAAETKSFVAKPPQNCQSSCVCNLCKKAFPDVRAMLRHKNMAHKKRTTYKRKVKKTIKVKTLTKKPTKKEIEEEQLRFYMNVSHNIADNLLHYVDGTISQLRLSEDSLCNKRTLSDPESWNLNFCDQFGKPCSSNIVTSKTPEKVRPPEIFIATGLNKVDDCPNKTLISENSASLTEFKNEFRLNVLNNDMYFSKQSDTSCFCHICLVKIKEAQKRNVEERKKWINHKNLSVYVCLVCKEPFNSDCDFDEHCYNNHPLIDTQSILVKIESDKNKPPVIPYDMSRKVSPTPHGILTSDSQSSPLMLKTQTSSKCTKCKTIISTSFLHEHILRCGGNESYFVKKHFRKRMRRKRIKNTMKHRLDLTIKQLPSGERKRYKDFRIHKAKFKYDKNYFNFKNGKSNRGPFASVKETTPPCSACNKKFPSQAQLKNHQCSADKLKKVQRLTEFKDTGFRGNADLNLRQKEHCKRDLTPSFHSTALSKEQRTQNDNLQNKHPASSKLSGESLKVNMSTPQPCHVSKLVDSTNFESAMDLSISKKPSVLSATPDKHSRLLSTASKDLTKSPIDALKETIDRLTNKEVTKVAIENSGINKDSKIVKNKDKMIRDSKEKISNSKISTIVKIVAKKDIREKNICPGKDVSCEEITANKNVSGVKPKLGSDLTDGQNKVNKIVTNEKVIDTTGDKSNVIKGILLEEEKKKIIVPSKNVKSISVQSNPAYLEQNPCTVVSCNSNSPEIEKERDQTKNNSNFMKKSKKSLDEALKKITKSKPQIFDSALEVNKAVSLRNTENYKIDDPVCLNKIQPSLQVSNISSKKEAQANTQLFNITRSSDPKRSCDLHSHENISILTVSADKSYSADSNISESNEPKCMQSDDNILSVSKRSRKKLTPSKIVQSKLDVILPVKITDNNLKETINNKIKGLSQSIAKQLFSLDSKSNDSVLNAETVTDTKVSNQSHESSKMNNLTSSETNKKVVVCNTDTKSETEVPFSSSDIKKTKPLISNSENNKKTENTVAISEATVFNSETSKNSQIQYSNSDVNKKCDTPVSNLEVNNKLVIQVSNSETNKKAQTVINNSATNKESRILPSNTEIIEKTETTVTKSASKKKTEASALSSELGIKSIDSLTNLPINITGEVPAQLKAPLVNQIPCNSAKSLCSLTTTNSFKTIQAVENKSEALPVLQAPVLFLSNECLNSEVASSQDRDSPTLEVLVSSVTQNLENFDEQSCMDDDKFSISDPTEEKDSKISKTSLSGSLNFKVIMPEGGKLGVSQPLPLFPSETMKTTEQPVNKQLCIASNFPNLNQNNTTNNAKVLPDNFSMHDSLIKNVSGASFNKKIPSATNSSTHELANTDSTLTIPHMLAPIKDLDDNLTSFDVSLVHKETPKSDVSGTKKDNKNLNDSSSVEKIAEKKIDNLNDIYPKRIEKEETRTLPVVMASVPSPIKAQKSFESEVSLLHKVSKTYSKSTKTPTDMQKGTKSKTDASDEAESAPKTKSKLSLGRKGKKKSSNELDLSEPSKDECSSAIQLEAAPTSVSHLRAFRREQNDHLLDASESKSSSSKSDAKQKDESLLNKDNLPHILDPDTVNDSLASLDQKDIKKELEGEANVVIKRESEGAKKHACPYCMLEFAYLTNFRRHTKQCRSKAGIRCSREQPSTSSSYFMQHLPKKEEVEESMLNLLRHQIRQNQMIQEVERSDVEKEIVPPEPKKLQTYTCPHCHKIFLKLFEQVRHLTNVHLLSNEEIYLNNQKDVDQSKLNDEGSISSMVEENFSEENVNAIRIDQNSTSAVPICGEETYVTNQKSCPVRIEKVQETTEKSGLDESEQMNQTNASEDVSKEDASKISNENSSLKDSNERISDTTELVKSEDDSRSNEMNVNESIVSETPISNTSNSNEKELVHRQKNKYNNSPLFQDLPVYGQGRGRKKKSAENDPSSVSKRQEMPSIPCLKEESSCDSIDQRTDKGVDVDEDEKDSCSPKKIVVSKLKDTISHKMRLLTSKCPVPGTSNNEVKEEDLEAKVSPDSYLSRPSSHDSNAFTCDQSKSDIQRNTISGASVAEKEQILSTSSIPKRGRGRKSAPNLNASPDSKPVKGRKKRFSDPNVSETSHNDDLVTSTTSSESPKRSKRTSVSENNTTKLISSPKTPPKRKGFRNRASEASAIHSKTDSSNNVPQAGIKDLSSSSLPSTSSLSNFQFGKVKRLRRSRFPNYCDSESSFSPSMIPYDHSDSDDFVSSLEKRPVVKKKVLQKVCPICKKKFTASLERNRHVQLVHSRKGLETEESPSTPSVQMTENKPKKEVESPKSRTSFTRQCAKPLPPMKRKYEKQPNKELPIKRFK